MMGDDFKWSIEAYGRGGVIGLFVVYDSDHYEIVSYAIRALKE